MHDYILDMENITKEFPGVKALDNVGIKVKRGEIHALCGENGAGKSTLMKVLSGVYPCGEYSGDIFINGEKMVFRTIKDSEDAGIAIIHQELSLVKELSVTENIFLGNEINSTGIINFEKMYKETRELLRGLSLDINPNVKVKKLGLGQQQLIEIAKAVSKKPNLLILDEPTSSLTENEVVILFDILNRLKSSGVTCIYISHKLDEVMKIADTVTVLRDGKTIGTDKINNLSKEKIIKMMVGRELSNIYPKEEHYIGDKIFRVESFEVYDPINPGQRLVRNANFDLRKGEILGLFGLIGSGRTELVSSIYGSFEGKNAGHIYINNKRIYIKNPNDALNNGIAMVPEDRKKNGIIGILSILENMSLANLDRYRVELGAINNSEEVIDVKKYIYELQIKPPNMSQKVNNLSGGNQQKVVLGKNLLTKPRILILDEPTRGVDVGAKYEIYTLMFKLVKEGVSIIMVSSELPEILGLSDRILVMHDGELKGEFINEDITQEMIMECAIGGKKHAAKSRN